MHYDKKDTNITMINPVYNGNIWFTTILGEGSGFISEDNLNSWQWTKLIIPSNMKKQDYCILPNNKILITTNKLEHNKLSDGTIYELDAITKEWKENKYDILSDKLITLIEFKDNLNGVLAVLEPVDSINYRQHIYRSNNGAKDWQKLDNISNLLETDTFSISRIDYFIESDVLMCTIYNQNIKRHYSIFSRDFGDSWTDLRLLPQQDQGPIRNISQCGFYIRNDSLWFAGGVNHSYNQNSRHNQIIYFSPDLGITWFRQYYAVPNTTGDLFSAIEFFDNSLVGLVCERISPRVFITFNGGNDWISISDAIGNFGVTNSDDPLNKDIDKFTMRKVDNKMIFFGYNRIFKFNNLNLPTSVDDESEDNFLIHYNPKMEAIELNSDSNFHIEQITLYDITGRELYRSSFEQYNSYFITKDKLKNTKVVFAIIKANNQMYLKQLLCE
jgi:hypothetical protein